MLIELNRFLTTEEVRREYRVPDALADVLLPALPVAVVLDDGTRLHLESEVDRFLAVFARRLRPPAASPVEGGTLPTRLTETEQNILEALGDGKLTGEQLAMKAGYPCNSNFKNTLASLVKRGILVNDRPGYTRPPSGLGQV